ncbi:MAG TPA: hypothetical protein PK691_11285, partial [Thermomicrobiales bacterium]|nr:hypothetical protein [Thermomicrobiales bacterium]
MTKAQEKADAVQAAIDQVPKDPAAYFRSQPDGIILRDYQIESGLAVAKSILARDGKQFAIVFSRQAGKDEVLAQLLAWLLIRHAECGGNAIIAAPTMRPQAAISRDRLVLRLRGLLQGQVTVRDGYIVEVGKATARFLSADPDANVRGQTADLLLVANEAQDIDPDVWDPVFDPMAASTNATTLFMGTPWTLNTLLARQMRHIRQEGTAANDKRLFMVPWQMVANHVPGYGERVRARIAQFGERHPFIRTEYELEELDGEESFFHPGRLAAMQGDHSRESQAQPGQRYAFLIDVAGEEEFGMTAEAMASNSRRDSTALTVVRIDRPNAFPVYHVVDRMLWTGTKHVQLQDEIVRLARETWKVDRILIDKTGIGAGLTSFLTHALADRAAGRVIPVHGLHFSAQMKSEMVWNFI